MEKMNINLATFEYDDKRISYPLLMGAVLIILIISGLSVHFFLNNQMDIKDYEKNIARLGQENIILGSNNTSIYQKMDSLEIETIHKEIDLINELIIKDIFPWDKLISNLERNMPTGIKLLDLTMSDDLSKLKLQCKAVSVRDISSFLTQLNSSKIYRNNNLLNLSVAQENVLQESQKGENLVIKFEIESSVVKDQLFTN